MKIIVCVKQVPDTSGKVAVNPDGTLNRASMATITNPDDLNAVEAALALKDQMDAEVVVVCMGPPPAEGMLRECLARGCDRAVLVSGREFGGSDTYATSQILAAAINKIGVDAEDIVMCGRQAIDGDTAQVVPQIAEKLGLPRAAEIIREAMYRGADAGIVLTDRALGGADTLATSYSLAQAVKKFGNYDIILGGRQAIDGDTAQVGPQIAEKLGIPQVTYAEEILDLSDGTVTVKRRLENGVETVKAPLPCVVTVNGSAAECRPRNAKRLQKYKYAASTSEKEKLDDRIKALLEARPYLNIAEWSAAYVDADPEQIGLAGSPTKVKAIENVVFTAKESRCLSDKDNEIEDLIKELIANHTIG